MKNHFRGATPELLAKALFSKSAARSTAKLDRRCEPSSVKSSA